MVNRIVFQGHLDNAIAMEKYMRGLFQFVGVKSPERKMQEKIICHESQKWTWVELENEIEFYYSQAEREYQYLAIDLALKNIKRIEWSTMRKLMTFNAKKAWWDSVDAWRKVYGLWFLAHPEKQAALFDYFAKSTDFWNRRVAITLQLQFKAKTNEKLLIQAIEPDLETAEFFIQKAIGWALRDYAKTNPQFVVKFIREHELSNLAKREAEKHL